MKKLKLLGKIIDIEQCDILLNYSPNIDFLDYFDVKAGKWSYDNGYLIGIEDGNKGGILYSKECYDCNILLSFTVSTILPATRDLNAVWCSNWDDSTDYLGDSYVCGINGWYDNKSGIEKCGKESFNATTTLFEYIPGSEIRITCGSIDGHCFLYVDDKLILETFDNNPLKVGHVGFSPYCTMLKIKDIEIRKINYINVSEHYDPEF